ncbi:MAG: hypothetical protein FH762_15780 [Firmicutes bacterium]|nr:hypothetical protein [Bacillota bacterium]
MLNKRIIKIILILLVLVSGCAANEELGNNAGESIDNNEGIIKSQEKVYGYFPMLEGMHYEYKGEGIEYAAFIRDVMYVDSPFIQVHDNNGGTTIAAIYKVEENQIALIRREEEFYSDKNLLSKLDKDVKVEEIVLKTPIKKGSSWESNNKKMEIVETNMELKVPAGTFYDVIKLKSHALNGKSEMINYSYYAKNMGLIKRESVGENFNVISELKAYENLKFK